MDHDGRTNGGGVGGFEMRAQILVAAWVQIAFEMLKSENQQVATAWPVTDSDSRVHHHAPADIQSASGISDLKSRNQKFNRLRRQDRGNRLAFEMRMGSLQWVVTPSGMTRDASPPGGY